MTQLASAWTFYGFKQSQDHDVPYESQIHPLAKFSTVEEFWPIYSHLVRPHSLPESAALHLFRGDSRAMREDAEHANGGSYLVRVSRGLGSYYWEQLVLNLITGQFSPDVIGGIISARGPHFNILLWHQTAPDADLRRTICTQLCELLHLPQGVRIDYTAHNSVLNIGEGGKQTIHYILEEEGPVETEIPQRHRSSE